MDFRQGAKQMEYRASASNLQIVGMRTEAEDPEGPAVRRSEAELKHQRDPGSCEFQTIQGAFPLP